MESWATDSPKLTKYLEARVSEATGEKRDINLSCSKV